MSISPMEKGKASYWVCRGCGRKYEAFTRSDTGIPQPECCAKCGGTDFSLQTKEANWLQRILYK